MNQLTFDKGKSIGREESFQHRVLGQLKTHMQINAVEPLRHPVRKNGCRWILDLNLRAKTIQLWG